MFKIKKGAEPFYHKKGKTGILLIHGFTGSCADFKEVGSYLASKGITVYGMLIEGHGTSPEHLMDTGLDDWVRSVEDAYMRLRKDCNKIYIGGLSFGGNLAFLLAEKYDCAGIISMGTVIKLRNHIMVSILLPFLRRMKRFKKKWYMGYLDKKIMEKRFTYDRFPLKCIPDVFKVIRLSKKALKNIKAPILIMHSTTDKGVDKKSVDYIFNHINSSVKRIFWVKDAYHVFIVDKNNEKTFKEIYRFIESNKNE